MTRKVFWEDPYLTRLETRIATVDGADVTVEETILYAIAGGQESDRGTIGGRPVRDARWVERDIVYTLDEDHGLAAGEPVLMLLDWERRHRLMRLHFAAELVLELANRTFPSLEKIGAHIAEDKARIDFALDRPVTPQLPALCMAAQAIIAADPPIVSAYSDEAAERRYWEIPGFARVPCGGTHLRSAGEVGDLALKRRNVGRGKERIEILLA